MRKRYPVKQPIRNNGATIMQDLSSKDVLNSLRSVIDPELGRDLVSLGMIQDVHVDGGLVQFTLRLTTPACPLREQLKGMAHQAVAALPGVREVHVKLDAQVPHTSGLPGQKPIPGVRQIIAVASGKGGVGKSTVAVNLALALSSAGARVGLLDADFYGPNVPQMLGSQGRAFGQRTGLVPVSARGLQVMSFAYLVEPGKPVIWRGPLLMGAIQQLLFDTQWEDLDYLVVDLPPGTGDVPLSLAQLVPLAGVVIVTTPQSVAVSDVMRSIEMFQALGTPVLGVVENMSFLECPDCGKRVEIFGRGGGQFLADQYDLPLLAQIPLDPGVCQGADEGKPAGDAIGPVATAFRQLAEKVAAQVSIQQLTGVTV